MEESLTLAIRDFRGQIYHNSSGTLMWTIGGSCKSLVGYFVTLGRSGWPIVISAEPKQTTPA